VLLTRVARAVALETIEADLVRLDGVESAVMRRYDRVVRDAGITRLHQEDLCQALGRLPATKYEQEGGPSFVEAMGIVRQHSSEPLVDAGQLLRWLLFGLLVGNADGHGKNLSLLHTEGGGLRLAPFYDLVCTRVYPRLDRRLAMSIGGMRDPGLIGRRHLESLADVTGIGRRLVLREAEGLATRLPDAFEEAAEAHLVAHGKTPIVERIRSAIRAQCRRTRSLLDQ
jgi:serine/threonine-protein kinase HipA